MTHNLIVYKWRKHLCLQESWEERQVRLRLVWQERCLKDSKQIRMFVGLQRYRQKVSPFFLIKGVLRYFRTIQSLVLIKTPVLSPEQAVNRNFQFHNYHLLYSTTIIKLWFYYFLHFLKELTKKSIESQQTTIKVLQVGVLHLARLKAYEVDENLFIRFDGN